MLLFTLVSCASLHLPPPVQDWSWQVDRASLPGGSVSVLHTATTEFSEAQTRARGGPAKQTGPVSAYLFTHPGRGRVLIDAGMGRRTAADPKDFPGGFTANLIGLEMGTPALDQLEAEGVSASDIGWLVLTHLHSDHAGGIEDFPGAKLVVDAREWEAGQHAHLGQDPSPYVAHSTVEALDFAADGAQPYGPLADHIDYFGDGSLVLLPTPGHTPGHVSVLVNLPQGSVLFTGDAAWVRANFDPYPTPKGGLARTLLEDDWRTGMEAVHRFRQWAARHPELTVVSGHEPESLTLPTWPEPLF